MTSSSSSKLMSLALYLIACPLFANSSFDSSSLDNSTSMLNSSNVLSSTGRDLPLHTAFLCLLSLFGLFICFAITHICILIVINGRIAEWKREKTKRGQRVTGIDMHVLQDIWW